MDFRTTRGVPFGVWLDMTSGRCEISQCPWLARLPFRDAWNRRVCGNFLCVRLHQQQKNRVATVPNKLAWGHAPRLSSRAKLGLRVLGACGPFSLFYAARPLRRQGI